jgi:hypothetical protein
MAKSIDVLGFSGMVDLSDTGSIYADEQQRIARPSAILNADLDIRGRLVKRSGQTLSVSLPSAHSLWSGQTCMLCADSTTLYRVVNNTVIAIATISPGNAGAPTFPLSYIETGDLVYISSQIWNGVYNHVTGTLSGWGVPLPPSPVVLSCDGVLPPGVYNVCMTQSSGSELSGNGPITTISLSTEGGLRIFNRPSGAIVWCTDCNEGTFYRIGETDYVLDIMTIEPLPSLFCHPPPLMTNLCHAFGRIWGSGCGSNSNILYYSQPFNLSWFRSTMNKFTFDTEITLIARAPTGLFVGTEERTVFLHGVEPSKMEQSFAGAGSIRGTLAYCNNLPELGDILGTAEKGYVDVPVWRTMDGIVAGNASGKLYNLTKNKVVMDAAPMGASLYRNVDGTFQFLTSSIRGVSGSSIGSLNPDTLKLFEDGKVSRHEFTHQGQGSTASFRDIASCDLNKYFARESAESCGWVDESVCTVTRGGTEI